MLFFSPFEFIKINFGPNFNYLTNFQFLDKLSNSQPNINSSKKYQHFITAILQYIVENGCMRQFLLFMLYNLSIMKN